MVPSRVFVQVRVAEDDVRDLSPGAVIGRHPSCALCLDDARVSEAHAMVSLREGRLMLIGLRGAFGVGGRPVDAVELEAGLVVHMAPGLPLDVVAVHLPSAVLALEGPAWPRQVLPGVCSLLDAPPRLVHGYERGAAAWIWTRGDGYRVQRPGDEPRALRDGDTVEVGGVTLTAVAAPLAAAGVEPTVRRDGVSVPLRIVSYHDVVHVHRPGRPALTLTGVTARIVGELAALGAPVHWSVLAWELWSRDDALDVLRARLDVNLSRLRRKLRDAGVRVDLVQSDGAGFIGLLLYPHDAVEDRG